MIYLVVAEVKIMRFLSYLDVCFRLKRRLVLDVPARIPRLVWGEDNLHHSP